MENSSNGWVRLALLTSAIVTFIGAIKMILQFLADLGDGHLNWSLA